MWASVEIAIGIRLELFSMPNPRPWEHLRESPHVHIPLGSVDTIDATPPDGSGNKRFPNFPAHQARLVISDVRSHGHSINARHTRTRERSNHG